MNSLKFIKHILKNSPNHGYCYSSTSVSSATDLLNNKKEQFYGQPTPKTHPHILNEGEVTSGITINEYRKRRNKLMQSIFQMSKSNNNTDQAHLVVIPAATKCYISEKIPHVFRQNSDMLYLSGCLEPDTILVLTGDSTTPDTIVSTLFVRENDSYSLIWDGPRTGTDEAVQLFGVDKALPFADFNKFLESYLQKFKNRQLWYDALNPVQPQVHKSLRMYIQRNKDQIVSSPRNLLHRLRVLKSPTEAQLMRATCRIGGQAVVFAMGSTLPGCSEHQLFACVDYQSRMQGAERLAYPPVVASGPRSTIIHYIDDNQLIANGDLVLMDAGCEYRGYSSDITRTWPSNGRFSPEQKILYETLLLVQKTLIKKLDSLPSLDTLYKEMLILLGKHLQEAGVLSNKMDSEQINEAVTTLCPHHVSHYLGMDVHDTAAISRGISLHPGMVITVEPGIYITPKHTFVPKEFHNMGIRIEDDIYISPTGKPEVLTESCPKEIEEIEKTVGNLMY